MLVLKTGPITNADVPVVYQDLFLRDFAGGVLSLFDTAYAGSYAGGSPANGAVVKDISGVTGDGVVNRIGAVSGTQLPTFAGGGFDFSGVDTVGGTVDMPSAIAEHIAGQTNGYFLLMGYVRFPSNADWAATVTSTSQPIWSFATEANGWQSGAELAMLHMANPSGVGPRLSVQIANGASYQGITYVPTVRDFGNVCQVAVYRTASGAYLRVQSPTFTTVMTAAAGAKTTKSFTGRKWHLGIGSAFWPTQMTAMKNFRLYRGAAVDLEAAGISDPTAALNADCLRRLADARFS